MVARTFTIYISASIDSLRFEQSFQVVVNGLFNIGSGRLVVVPTKCFGDNSYLLYTEFLDASSMSRVLSNPVVKVYK